jgi:hypothetical protein
MTESGNTDDIGYILIDPPVSVYSPAEEILAWIKELEQLPDRPEVRSAMTEALKMLELRNGSSR